MLSLEKGPPGNGRIVSENKWIKLEPQCEKSNDLGFESSKDSDQPRNLPRVIDPPDMSPQLFTMDVKQQIIQANKA